MATDLLSTISAEIDERLRELGPLLAEYERLLVAAEALDREAAPTPRVVANDNIAPAETRAASRRAGGRVARKASGARGRVGVRTASRARRSDTEETILGVLEHGSHTVGELVVVTAMSTAKINTSLRRLTAEQAVMKTEREGKIAYALA